MKKTLAAAALLTAATGAMLAMSAPAQAAAPEGMGDDTQQVRIGDNLCALPWYWEGPGNAGVVGKSVTYKACTGDDDDAKVSILSDICVAPWHWNGPLNILNFGVSSDYQACTEG